MEHTAINLNALEYGFPTYLSDKSMVWQSFQCCEQSCDRQLVTDFLLDNDPGHYERPIQERFRQWQLSAGYYTKWSPQSIRLFLWKDGKVKEEDIEESLEGPVSILHWISFQYGRNYNHEVEPWEELMGEVLGLCVSSELHSLAPRACILRNDGNMFSTSEVERSTPLFEFVRGIWMQMNVRDDPIDDIIHVLGECLKSWLRRTNAATRSRNITFEERVTLCHGESEHQVHGEMEYQAMSQYIGKCLFDDQDLQHVGPWSLKLLDLECRGSIEDWSIKFGAEKCDQEMREDSPKLEMGKAPTQTPSPSSIMPGAWDDYYDDS